MHGDNIKKVLFSELSKARAPITQRKIVCVLLTKKGLYSGHNFETKKVFFHAERRALLRMKKNKDFSKINSLYLTGMGKELTKIKQVSPCSKCFDSLLPFLSKKCKTILFEPNTFDDKIILTYKELIKAYVPQNPSELKGMTFKEIKKELKRKTPLSGKELSFVASLRLFGLSEGISFYLTGSKSGRGGLAVIINKKKNNTKGDLDIVAVSNLGKRLVEKKFEDFASRFFKIKKKVVSQKWFYMLKQQRRFLFYYDVSGRKVLELCVGKDLKNGMVRMDFVEKNFYHKLC
jgi:cytidine deaminase